MQPPCQWNEMVGSSWGILKILRSNSSTTRSDPQTLTHCSSQTKEHHQHKKQITTQEELFNHENSHPYDETMSYRFGIV